MADTRGTSKPVAESSGQESAHGADNISSHLHKLRTCILVTDVFLFVSQFIASNTSHHGVLLPSNILGPGAEEVVRGNDGEHGTGEDGQHVLPRLWGGW